MTFTSLRERKKAQTRDALARAAFEVTRDLGPDRLTAEVVADRAGVSRRTFFNYFPSVDAAVAASVEGLLGQLTETLSARPADESIWATIPLILTGKHGTELIERVAVLGATRDHSPQARLLAQDHVEAFVDWLAQWLTTRLGPDADEVYAATLAASVAASAEATLRLWTARTGGQFTPAFLEEYRTMLTRALELLRVGFENPTS